MNHKPLTVIQVLPALNGGGVERGTLEIGQYLVQQGHRSIVVSAGGRMVEQLIQEGSEHFQARIGIKSPATLKYIPWFRKLLLNIRPDIIHLRSRLPAWICYLAWKSLPQNKRPHLVTTFHGQHSVNRYSKIMTCGEQVITVSEFMKKHILSAYPDVDAEKIVVIPRGIDTSRYYPGYRPDAQWLEQWSQYFPQTRNKKILTLPGRISRRKGIEDFIAVIKSLQSENYAVHGLIVGETNSQKNQYLNELKQLIQDQQLSHAITFTGHRSDLQNILAISDIVFSLSKKPESFGRTVTEALSMAVPVVAYDHGGVSEQLQQLFPTGKVPLNDIDAAAKTAKNILSQKNILISANETYTLARMCSETLAVYTRLTTPSKSNINNQ